MNSLSNRWRQKKFVSRQTTVVSNSPNVNNEKNQLPYRSPDFNANDTFSASFITALETLERECGSNELNCTLNDVSHPVKRNNQNSKSELKSIKRRKLTNSSNDTIANEIIEIEESQLMNFVNRNNNQSWNCHYENIPTSRNENYNEEEQTSINLSEQLDKLLLSSWGLPPCVLEKYERMNIISMFQWQVDCLMLGNVLNGGNLVYSAPTSAGKTLIAEILILKRVLELRKKAIIILPFVSVAQEKMYYLRNLFQETGVRVDGFIGNHHPRGGWKRVDVAVCTIEKANSLINRLMEENKLHKLGTIVVDELHMLGDHSRGYLLELLLTKIRYMSWKIAQQNKESEEKHSIQIIGMSATLPNLDLLAYWLQAELYHTDFRPVPLSEYYKVGNRIFNNRHVLVRDLVSMPELCGLDCDHVIQLCLETVTEGHSVLVFCPSKAWCEALAKSVAKQFCNLGCDNSPSDEIRKHLRSVLDSNSLCDVLEQLKRVPSGLDSELAKCISFGTAFHHAGLTIDEREIIEIAFRNNIIRVLVATSTLSSGVNLPARRVIVRSPLFCGKLMDVLTYRQMIGRAGRKGIDTQGESILICKENEASRVNELIKAKLKPIKSCLIRNDSLSASMKRAILEVVVSGVASSPDEVERYCSSTLIAASFAFKNEKTENHENGDEKSANAIKLCIKYLMDNEFIILRIMCDEDGSEKKKYVPTPLGNAIMASSMSPDEGLIIFRELEKARQCFVLENELHIVYQVTPIHVSEQWTNMNCFEYLAIWQELPLDQQRVGEIIGVKDRYLMRLTRMDNNHNSSRQSYREFSIVQRFFTALALLDLVNEVPLNVVAKKYNCNRGMLQSLQQSAATFAGMVTTFCNRLGWINMELLLAQFQNRLNFGIQRELCDLVRLSSLNGQRARLLFNKGFCSVSELANADFKDIEIVLKNSGPFQSDKQRDGETAFDVEERRKNRCVLLVGKKGVTETEAAKLIVQEARQLLQKDLGVNIEWNCSLKQNDTPMPKISLGKRHVIQNGNHTQQMSNSKVAVVQTQVNKNIGPGNTLVEILNEDSQISNNELDSEPSHIVQTFHEKFSSNLHSPLNVNKVETSVTETSPILFPPIATSTPFPQNKSNSASLFGDSSLEAYMRNCTLPSSTPKQNEDKEENINLTQTAPHVEKTDEYGNEKEENINLTQISPRIEKTDEYDNEKEENINLTQSTSNFVFTDGLDNVMEELEENMNLPRNGRTFESLDDVEENSQAENDEDDNLGTLQLEHSFDSGNDCEAKTSLENERTKLTCDYKKEKFTKLLNFSDNDSKIDFISEESVIENDSLTKDVSLKDLINLTKKSNTVSSPYFSFNLSEKALRILDTAIDFQSTTKTVAKQVVTKTDEKEKLNEEMNVNQEIEQSKQAVIEERRSNNTNKTPLKTPLKTPVSRKRDCLQFTGGGRNIKLINNLKNKQNIRKISSGESDCQDISEYDSDSDMEMEVSKVQNEENTKSQEKKERKMSDDSFTIIDVAAHKELFSTFIEEWKQQDRFSLSVACVKLANEEKSLVIGAKVKGMITKDKIDKTSMNFHVEDRRVTVVGLAVSWEDRDAYYISLTNDGLEDETLPAPLLDSTLSLSSRIEAVKNVLESKHGSTLVAYDLKDQLRVLMCGTKIFPMCRGEDPKIGVWLFDPTEREQTLHSLVLDYCPDDKSLLKRVGGCRDAKSIGLTSENSASPRVRASIECVLSLRAMNKIKIQLKEQQLLSCFLNVEMPVVMILTKMELNGFGFNTEEFRKHLSSIEKMLVKVERKAHNLAGRKFSLTSPNDIAKVLFTELRLQYPVDNYGNHRVDSRRSSSRRRKKFNTNKSTLNQLTTVHPLPGLILEYRKLSNSLSKIVYPLLKMKQLLPKLKMDRIFGSYRYFTATGRVSMQEPNLQTVPRDMEINSELSLANTISLRSAFVPFSGGILLSADYSQLELRILAHLSHDRDLLKVLNGGGDVFKGIASQWKEKSLDEVTSNDRQQAKQICYGMIYGIGAKTLSGQLNVDEDEAATFMENFKNKYTGIKSYIHKVVKECQSKGYVKTIMGRRRYLPNITNNESVSRSQAERQAVNTTIQGSAADLAKMAMIKIDKALNKQFSASKPYADQDLNSISIPVGGTLVLQLHDELIYEVNEDNLIEVARIVKKEMESAIKLSVNLPVTIQTGYSWGSFKEFQDF